MGLLVTCMRVFMIILNIVALLVGLILLVLGAILIGGRSIIESLLSSLTSQLNTLTSGTSASASTVSASDLIDYIMDLLKTIGTPILIIGIFVAAMGFCGLFGTCCSSKCLLFAYVAMSGLLMLALLLFIIIFNANKSILKDIIKNEMNRTQVKYTGIQTTNVESVIWNLLHYEMKCCGVNNGSDFSELTTWNRTFYSDNQVYLMKYPYTCCKLKSDLSVEDSSCPRVFNTKNSFYDTGCYSVLTGFLDEYYPLIFGVIGGLVGYQGILLFFGIWIVKDMGKVSPI